MEDGWSESVIRRTAMQMEANAKLRNVQLTAQPTLFTSQTSSTVKYSEGGCRVSLA
jgi:hypothetical protein